MLNKRGYFKRVLKKMFVSYFVLKASGWLPTGSAAKEYLAHYGADPEKCFFFPNTPDIDHLKNKYSRLKNEKDNIKSDLGINTDRNILFVGRLIGVKGLEYLIDAFGRIQDDNSDTGLIIAGCDLVRNGENGFVVSSADSEELYSSIEKMLSDEKKLKQMGRASYEMIDDWTYEKGIESLKSALSKIFDVV